MTPRTSSPGIANRRWIALAVAALVGGLAGWAWLRPTPEKAVKAAIALGIGACEREDLDALGAFVADEWRGEHGDNREEILEALAQAFREIEDLDVATDSLEVIVTGDTARALLVGTVSGAAVSTGVYSRVPFRGIFGEQPGKPEAFYMELSQQPPGPWRLEYVHWRVQDVLDDFPGAKALLAP